MAFSHGANDAQNSMGIITMALLSAGFWPTPGQVKVLLPVRCLAAGAMGAGTAFGGWRIIKTLGRRMMQLQPIHGCAAETGGAIVVQICTHLGLPISTTHVISSAIMGVGSARRLSAVRWRVAGNIVAAWLMTFPATALLGAIGYKVFSSLT
jgi:PiT family inorganic phosphate transporter